MTRKTENTEARLDFADDSQAVTFREFFCRPVFKKFVPRSRILFKKWQRGSSPELYKTGPITLIVNQ